MKINLVLLIISALFLLNLSLASSQQIFQTGEDINITTYSKNSKNVSSFTPDQGKQIAAFALNAYCRNGKIEKWNCGKTCKEYPGMTDITIVTNDKNNKGYIGYYPYSNAIVISWRGTLALSNWLEDFDVTLTEFPFCSECQVHKGFYQAYQGLQENFWTTFTEIQQKYPKAQIWLTGHSLGAALSTFNAADLVKKGITDFVWYNYGSPRVGNQNFASWLQNTYDGVLYRVTHHKDPVPHFPGRGLGYWHLAEEVFYVDDPQPDAEHILCDMSGEDPNCADRYGFDLLYFGDHLTYMGYAWIKQISLCLL